MNDLCTVTATVNDTRYERAVEPRLLLSDFLRHELGHHLVHRWSTMRWSPSGLRWCTR